jgi:hypothetical protein
MLVGECLGDERLDRAGEREKPRGPKQAFGTRVGRDPESLGGKYQTVSRQSDSACGHRAMRHSATDPSLV